MVYILVGVVVEDLTMADLLVFFTFLSWALNQRPAYTLTAWTSIPQHQLVDMNWSYQLNPMEMKLNSNRP